MDTKLVQKFDANLNELTKVEAQIINATVTLQKKKAKLLEADTQFRTAIKEAMEKNNVKKFENDNVVITYIAASTRKGFDGAALKAAQPKIYEEYAKETPVSSSIRIKVLEK